MKNFRKVLALVLALATLFSFAAIAGASFEDLSEDVKPEIDTDYYSDEDSIEYLEAVRVLSHVGILNGYEDGTFKANNSIRRNEMAKMIAVLANAGYDIEELYASAANFADVPADDWAASYIAYCAKTGIVAGRSATTFDPNASVTGLETAKMLLVVLGFDAENQGYVGANWKINVLRDAKVMGLLEGFEKDYNVEAAITRDEAANMMLNALKAPCALGYLTDASSVKVTNTWIFGDFDTDDVRDWTNFARVNSYVTLKDAVSDEDWAIYGDVVISDDILCEVLFDIFSIDSFDCFGRPTTRWISSKNRKYTVANDGTKLGGVVIWEATEEPIFESYDVDQDELEEVLFPYFGGDYQYILSVYGRLFLYGLDHLQDLVDDLYAEDAGGYSFVGKGVKVEVYERDEQLIVVPINTFIGKVIRVDAARGNAWIGSPDGSVSFKVDNDKYGYTAADVKNETVVLFWLCDHNNKYGDVPGTNDFDPDNNLGNEIVVHNAIEIEPVTAEVTRADVDGKGNHSFVADGTTYEYAENFGLYLGGIPMDEDFNFYNNGGREHDIYCDLNGYVMWHEWTDNSNTEIVVIDGDSWISKDCIHTSDGVDYEVNTADFIYFEEDAPIRTVDTTVEFNFGELGLRDNSDILAWVEYVEDGDDTDVYMQRGHVAAQSNYDIYLEKGKVKIGAEDLDHEVRDYLVNSNTQIIVRVPDYFGEDEEDSFTYLYFDGINDIDANYKAEEFQFFLDNECDQDGEGRFYSHIYIDAVYARETNRAFILRSAGASVIKLENGRVMGGDKYEAIVNGEEAIVVYDEMTTQKVVRTQLNRTGTEIPVMIKSNLVLVGWTLDDIPVWSDPAPISTSDPEFITNAEDPDFMINGGVLSWNEGDNTVVQWEGLRMDPECAIWVAMPDKKGDFVAKLIDQDEFNNFRYEYGWDTVDGYAWAVDALDETNRTDGLYDYLLIVVTPAFDDDGNPIV